jgi:hypothetical protein
LYLDPSVGWLKHGIFSRNWLTGTKYQAERCLTGEICLQNLTALERAGTAGRMEIVWQYILFQWNDSDQKLTEARQLAAEIGVPIKWVFTHTGLPFTFRLSPLISKTVPTTQSAQFTKRLEKVRSEMIAMIDHPEEER